MTVVRRIAGWIELWLFELLAAIERGRRDDQ